MQGELIENIFIPRGKDWFLLQTNKELYCLTLGGFHKIEQIEMSLYTIANFPLIAKKIARVYSDDFLILIEMTAGDALKHSPDAWINSEGDTWFGLAYLNKEQCLELKKDYESSLLELK